MALLESVAWPRIRAFLSALRVHFDLSGDLGLPNWDLSAHLRPTLGVAWPKAIVAMAFRGGCNELLLLLLAAHPVLRLPRSI